MWLIMLGFCKKRTETVTLKESALTELRNALILVVKTIEGANEDLQKLPYPVRWKLEDAANYAKEVLEEH